MSMKTNMLIVMLLGVSLASACGQSSIADVKGFIDAYFVSRSTDILNKEEKSKLFLSKTFYNPGTEGEAEMFVISRDITVGPVKKDVAIIDSGIGLQGDVYQVEVLLRVQSEVSESRLVSPKRGDHKIFIDLVSTNSGFKINTDTSFNTDYIFEGDYKLIKK